MIYLRIALPVIVCLLLFFSCSPKEKEQVKHKYLITASVRNCEGCQVMVRAGMHTNFECIDSTVVKDGKFELRGEMSDSGFYDVSIRHPKKFIPIIVFLPADSVSLSVDANSLLRAKPYTRKPIEAIYFYSVWSTSPHQAEVDKYILLRDSLWNEFMDDRDLVVAKFNQTYGSGDKALVQQWADSVENMRYRFASYMSNATDLFIRQGASPEAAVFAMLDSKNDRMATERFRAYFNALPAAYRNSQQGGYLDEQLRDNEKRNKNNQRFVGSRIRNLDFLGKTPQGHEVNEDSIFKVNQLTLVEFWASWCGPCRMELPKYYKLYQNYQSKGMGFIAVSMDNNYDRWVKAIKADGLQVHHISELKGDQGEDMLRFEVKGIPANMLIDTAGKIVAVDISPVELKKKLQESL